MPFPLTGFETNRLWRAAVAVVAAEVAAVVVALGVLDDDEDWLF